MNLNYLFRLGIKKTRIIIHNKIEKRIKTDTSIDLNTFILFLFKEIFKNIHLKKKGAFYRTKIENNDKPVVVSQARLISLLCDGYNKNDFIIKDRNLIEKLTDYLITLEMRNNLYSFNNSKWDKQDEGIASVWAGIAFIKAYEVIKKQKYLDQSISVFSAILRELYTPESGLVHTAGQDFWCLNASSKLAYLCSLILKYNYSEEIKSVMINSIRICTENIDGDGHFPYTEKRSGVYILLYHPSVMFYLDRCLESEYLTNEEREKIEETNKSALSFLINCQDYSGRFNEPELKEFNFYIITAVTALAAIHNKVDKNEENKILHNVLKYYNNNKLYLFNDNDDYLSDRNYYRHLDILIVETLYWLVQYNYGH